ncbi:MAG: NADH-quinone oxidoreductase subunit L [Verrucomicrobia bacterium]|nr:MAG: NADH dehydrogenase [Verrucomicrobia bacterium 13_2_20CM_2_54_15]PYL40777.1 MAG: NADH-quinone oxidoreductase subunit L [Verrucomicrobiota bacterium]
MSDQAPSSQMLNVQIDGVWHQFPKGTRVIEACERVGSYVPRYCYHKKLSSPGNCRMCLTEMGFPKLGPDRKPELGPDNKPIINWMPRPQISCAQDVAEGMGVRTNSPLVKECQRGVMEFLLINHPLDCPICDQAGECRLQEFSVDFGTSKSRFLENKVKKPKNVVLGPRVRLDDERCILCSRCIRFCQEIAHDDVLGFVDRGSYTVLTAYPGKRLENNYSLNTVDICPVGALTSTDFRFKMRVWFLKETKSICTSCATGCNTVIGSREDVIHRQTPRENDHVNSCWMCDYGRLNFKYLEAENRLLEPQIRFGEKLIPTDWSTAIAQAALQLKGFSGSEIAIIASGRMTNEELWLTLQLAKSLDTQRIDIVPRREPGDNILLSEDRNPNTNGARLILGSKSEPGANLLAIADAVRSGRIKALVILKENTMHLGIPVEELAQLPVLIMMNVLPNEATEKATVLLPGCGFAEKRGSMVNGKGRLQRLNRAVRPPGNARDDWEILRDLLQAIGGGDSLLSIDDVFRRISETVPQFAGLTLSKIGDLGTHILQMDELPPAHPSDDEKIEQAVAMQARRRAVPPRSP